MWHPRHNNFQIIKRVCPAVLEVLDMMDLEFAGFVTIHAAVSIPFKDNKPDAGPLPVRGLAVKAAH